MAVCKKHTVTNINTFSLRKKLTLWKKQRVNSYHPTQVVTKILSQPRKMTMLKKKQQNGNNNGTIHRSHQQDSHTL